MFENKKWMKRVALIAVIVLSVSMMASCQSGRTYEDVAGSADGIYVTGKEQQPVVPYTGDPYINWTQIDDRDKADEIVAHGEKPGGGSGSTSTPGGNETPDETPGEDVTPDGNENENPGTNQEPDNSQTTPGGNENDNAGGDEDDATYDPANLLKVISYNVRVGNDGNGNDIKERAPRLKQAIANFEPDVMGFQEVNPEWLDGYLIPYYSGEYEHINKYRSETGKESTPIFWKRDKFEMKDSGYFWLSETPDQESKGWNADHYRIACWVKLKLKSTGKEFLYVNTHYDFSDECHVGSAKLVINRMTSMGGFTKLPVFFTADCNMGRYEAGYNAMIDGGHFSDINWDLEDLNIVTGGGYVAGLKQGSPIDYCFYSPALIVPLKYKIIDEEEFNYGGFISDHNGLYLEMALK